MCFCNLRVHNQFLSGYREINHVGGGLVGPLVRGVGGKSVSTFPMVCSRFGQLVAFFTMGLRCRSTSTSLVLFFVRLVYGVGLSHFSSSSNSSVGGCVITSVGGGCISILDREVERTSFGCRLCRKCTSIARGIASEVYLHGKFGTLPRPRGDVVLCECCCNCDVTRVTSRVGVAERSIGGEGGGTLGVVQGTFRRRGNRWV